MFFSKMNGGQVQAIYTGRFAYLIGLDAPEAYRIFSNVVRSRDYSNKELTEEYRHFRLYMKSISGLYINGLRWFTRLLYSFTNNFHIAKDYYKARSIYFGLSYNFHEKQVHNNRQRIFDLIKIDIKVISRILIESRLALVFSLIFPVVILLGWIIAAHFTTRIRDLNSTEPKEINISKFGYIGLDREEKAHPALIKFGQIIQIERHVRGADHFIWMHAKACAEKEMWDCYGFEFSFGTTDTFEEYVRQYVRFIEHWFGMTGITPIRMIKYLMVPNSLKLQKLMNNQGLKCYAWFSYAHGN